jgi:citrate synthase
MPTIHHGLEGIAVAETVLSSVDGERGELIIAGYPVEELAPNASFEQVIYLLWNDRLPDDADLEAFRGELAAQREIPPATLDLLRSAAAARMETMDALRMAAGTLDLGIGAIAGDDDALGAMIVARFATIVAAYWRLKRGEEPVSPRADLDHAANMLYMLTGREPSAASARALETYLNTVVDHGLNASTFTARVITSTGSDLTSAIVGAVGALKGPLHGGAPGPALDMVFEIGDVARAEEYLRAKIERGERLMGFGHRVYKVRDPRADVLGAATERLRSAGGDPEGVYELARGVERIALELLEEYKPGRRLQTNVEFYTALLLHLLEIPTELFTPTFAAGRVAGWVAHCREQRRRNRIIRPQSVYVGERGRRWEVEVG